MKRSIFTYWFSEFVWHFLLILLIIIFYSFSSFIWLIVFCFLFISIRFSKFILFFLFYFLKFFLSSLLWNSFFYSHRSLTNAFTIHLFNSLDHFLFIRKSNVAYSNWLHIFLTSNDSYAFYRTNMLKSIP